MNPFRRYGWSTVDTHTYMVSRDKHVDRVNDDFTELSTLLKTRGGLSLVDERLETSLLEILKAETNLDDLVKKLEK